MRSQQGTGRADCVAAGNTPKVTWISFLVETKSYYTVQGSSDSSAQVSPAALILGSTTAFSCDLNVKQEIKKM